MKRTTCKGEAETPSKTRRLRSFHRFQAVYISNAATILLSLDGNWHRERCHHSSKPTEASGTLITPPVQRHIWAQTSLVKTQCKHRCAASSKSWSHRAQTGLQGQFRAANLSAVKILLWTNSQAKNLCFPSACAFHTELPTKVLWAPFVGNRMPVSLRGGGVN
jgi:hypothetical protein